MLKEKKGITLVALVITIIVLLILAGVSISLVVGDNGILGKAKSARDNTSKGQAQEAVELAVANVIGKYLETSSATDSNAAGIAAVKSAFTGNKLNDELNGYSIPSGDTSLFPDQAASLTTADINLTKSGDTDASYKFKLQITTTSSGKFQNVKIIDFAAQ